MGLGEGSGLRLELLLVQGQGWSEVKFLGWSWSSWDGGRVRFQGLGSLRARGGVQLGFGRSKGPSRVRGQISDWLRVISLSIPLSMNIYVASMSCLLSIV